MANNPPERNIRPGFRVAPKKSLIEQINEDIARRAALPPDHPDYAVDDSDTTGTMGLRDNPELRKNAAKLRGVK